jgi:hypothetical protein
MAFSIEPSVEIAHRGDFSLLANARGYVDAVEVGVDLGVFACEFLSRFKGHWLYLIDPYEPYADMPYDRTVDAYVAALALQPFHGRYRFIRAASPDAIPIVQRFIKPEFVYIDGDHREESVARDLAAWWEILPSHGMLAGHDHDELHPGVTSAVEKFARERDVVVRVTSERGCPPSWYIYRSEPSHLIKLYFDSGEVANPHTG